MEDSTGGHERSSASSVRYLHPRRINSAGERSKRKFRDSLSEADKSFATSSSMKRSKWSYASCRSFEASRLKAAKTCVQSAYANDLLDRLLICRGNILDTRYFALQTLETETMCFAWSNQVMRATVADVTRCLLRQQSYRFFQALRRL
jgi:hypothetical protein